MKKILLISFLLIFWQMNSFCQLIPEWMVEVNYVPSLINKGVDWQDIADSIQKNYPNKEMELRHVLNTITYLKSPKTDSISILINKFLESGYYSQQVFNEIKSMGRNVIPKLIQFSENDCATRRIEGTYYDDYEIWYLCISDIVINLIEEISGIRFVNNFSTLIYRKFSSEPYKERKEIIAIIQTWYNETKHLSNVESINYYLDSFNYTKNGSRIYTARNLAYFGDTTSAIIQLERMYNESKLPCQSNMLIAKMVNDFGKDIAMDDCLHDIFNYRCNGDHGVRCVSYIFDNANSSIVFDVLADIVSTERFSRYKRKRSKFIWHTIFGYMATTNYRSTKSILIELLKIEDELKNSKIPAHNWKKLYNEQYEAKFRVCDFSLYKLNELFPEMGIMVNWDDRKSLDEEIKRILNEHGG